MKVLAAIFLAGGLLTAQVVGGRAAGGVVFTNPSGFGNVAFPGTGRPTFNTGSGFGRQTGLRNGIGAGYRSGVGSYYGYPVIVGGGYGGYYDQSGYPQSAYSQQQQPNITIINNPPAQVAPTVVINQNFAAPPDMNGGDPGSSETTHVFQPAPRQDTGAVSDAAAPHYFLIAFKDHSVYSALTYWIEDKTMHYVTPQQTHNQASLDLIDLDFTKKLNQR